MDMPYKTLVKEFSESELTQKMYKRAKRDKFKKRFAWYVKSFEEHDEIKEYIQVNNAVCPEMLAMPEYVQLDEVTQVEHRYCKFLDDVQLELNRKMIKGTIYNMMITDYLKDTSELVNKLHSELTWKGDECFDDIHKIMTPADEKVCELSDAVYQYVGELSSAERDKVEETFYDLQEVRDLLSERDFDDAFEAIENVENAGRLLNNIVNNLPTTSKKVLISKGEST
ncbi:hypothetical protein [Thermoactinomyces sp. DSM 45892]|uniref:hypothetical protein n=1 Tax=Thermoactinomyces sp. DSM 45892 TaxID=1882753 RepID=UPI000894E302|nr:hypothetical protein [Thermoactinomyces sp. DSM 45892]SDY89138.1 hypothetical protein SAMN05444416_109187 [Thermoactinomyces sp. DSM 45892]